MSTLTLNDLTVSKDLERNAMNTVSGGFRPFICCYPPRRPCFPRLPRFPRLPFPIPRPRPFPCPGPIYRPL